MTQNVNRSLAGSFNSHQAADIVGITYRMLDHWVAKVGVMRPSLKEGEGSGSRRRFNYQDLLKLRIIKSLRDSGISLKKICEAFDSADRLGIDITRSSIAVEKKRVIVSQGVEVIEFKGQSAQPLLSLAFSPLDEVTAHVDRSILDRHPEHVTARLYAPSPVQLSFDLGSNSAASR